MILIFSNAYDYSTDLVIDWIDNFDVKWKRINGEDLIRKPYVLYNEDFLGELDIIPSEIKSIWFRRTIRFSKLVASQIIQSHTKESLQLFQRNEFFKIYDNLFYAISHYNPEIFFLNKPGNSNLNKLNVLFTARSIGLTVPRFCVTNSKKRLNYFLKSEKINKWTIKPISEIFHLEHNGGHYIPYTVKYDHNHLENVPDKFYPTFVQEYIEKEFEIRSVFLNNKFYSMVIDSGKDIKTKHDFRNYNNDNPNHLVRFNLPKRIEDLTSLLLKRFELNFCSIDFLYSCGVYFFLEINPVGQFSMTSIPCNYNIEKMIAKVLINNG